MLEFAIPTPASQADYERLFLHPQVQHWLRPPPLPPLDKTDVAGMLRRDVAHWDDHGFGLWVLRDAETGDCRGRAGLNSTEVEGEPAIEVGWTVMPGHWRRGLATEGARAAIAHARKVSIPEVVAFALPHNAASLRVMEKIGMRRVGPIEHAGLPHILYRIAT
jgi:RimJ/RimL family protein N-acetyltransferase